MTLVCEDANSKLVEVVTVANVDDDGRVGNSLLKISKLRFGQNSEARFGQDFEAYVLWRGLCLVEFFKLMLGRDSEHEI